MIFVYIWCLSDHILRIILTVIINHLQRRDVYAINSSDINWHISLRRRHYLNENRDPTSLAERMQRIFREESVAR